MGFASAQPILQQQKSAEEYAMAQVKWALSGLVIVALWLAAGASAVQGQTPGAAVFEGARLIVGDGSVIENATVVVTGDRITAVGRRGEVAAPAGAVRVDVTGKT